MPNEANRQINFRLPEEIAKRIEEEQLTGGKTLTEFARETVIAASTRQGSIPDATDGKESNPSERLEQIYREVLRTRISIFLIAEHSLSLDILDAIHAEAQRASLT
jgi:hypothetical protein